MTVIFNSKLRTLILLGLVATFGLVFTPSSSAGGNTDAVANKKLAKEMATLFRAARKVVSTNQAHINDASKGDKGLSGSVVVGHAKSNFKAATGYSLPKSDSSTLANDARTAMLNAIAKVMDESQELINEKGKGFKGFLPAVFAKAVADAFSDEMKGKMKIKLTAPKAYVRNRANRPDKWESRIIEEKFKSEGWVTNTDFSEISTHKGKSAFRFILPEYYGDSCLKCHGVPKGERDITGGKKEGGVLGELGGAISVLIFE